MITDMDLEIEPPLAFLYEERCIPHQMKEKLKVENGILSLEQLLSQRRMVEKMVQKRISVHASRLLVSIDFIAARRESEDFRSIKELFGSNPTADSYEYFLAASVDTKGLYEQKRAISVVPVENKKARRGYVGSFVGRIVPDDANYVTPEQLSVGSGMDQAALVELLKLGSDSPWSLDESLEHVLSKQLPELCIPVTLFHYLYPYQRSGLDWMAGLRLNKSGGILVDEMGMGKTIQVLSFLVSLMHTGAIRNALIVCPNPVVEPTWWKEANGILAFFPNCQVQVEMIASKMPELQRTKTLQKAKQATTDKPYLVIAPYSQFTNQLIPRGYRPFHKEFDYVVLDEAHTVKNDESNTTKNLKKVMGKESQILFLTGTPLPNRLKELHTLLSLAKTKEVGGDNLLDNWASFRAKFARPIEAMRQNTASEYERRQGATVLEQLHEKISPVVLLREKADHLGGIVPVNDKFDIWCNLSQQQRQLYQDFVKADEAKEQLSVGSHKGWNPLARITKLRMLCGHPLLQSTDNVVQRCQQLSPEKVLEMSPKLQALVAIVTSSCEAGHRVLIFSEFLGMLDIMEYVFSSRDEIAACRLDGKRKNKAELIAEFNKSQSLFNVMIATTKSGGVGITLTGANVCVIYDPVWSQAEADQAVARISRPGQTKECESYYMIAAGTVEEKMYGKQIYKGSMSNAVLNQDNRGSESVFDARLYNKDELSQLFELAPAGVCLAIERMGLKKFSANARAISKSEAALVGITRRKDAYNAKKRHVDNEDEVV